MDSCVIPVHIEEKTCAYLLRSMASSDVPFGLSAWIAYFCPMQSGIGRHSCNSTVVIFNFGL